MKAKTIVAVSILLASCAAIAADSPFEKGKTYNLFAVQNAFAITAEIKDVKGKWLLINDVEACRSVKSNECWVNSDNLAKASQAK